MDRNLTPQGELLLAVESATSHLSVALRLPDGRVIEREPEKPGQHAEAILPLIDRVLSEGGCSPGDPTAFAVSIGPGSFTSLRVGLATVKGLAFARECPIVPVPTLEVLALGARRAGEQGPIAALLDARRGDLYAAVFAGGGEGARLSPLVAEGLFEPEALAALLPDACVAVGEGAPVFAEVLGESLPGSTWVRADEATAWPRARWVAEIGLQLLAERGAVRDGADVDLAPRYVRRAEAEAKRTSQQVEDPT